MHSLKKLFRTAIAVDLFLVAALSFVTPRIVSAGTIHVTTTQQKISGSGGCSLQEAIWAANLDVSKAIRAISGNNVEVIDTECEAGDGDDTIELQSGAVYVMSQVINDPYNFMGPAATPIVFTNMTIAGNGARLERSNPNRDCSGTNFRAFAVGHASVDLNPGGTPDIVSGTGNLTIWNIYIKGFTAKGGNGTHGGGGGLGAGGAIYVKGGALTVERSTLQDNGACGGNGGGLRGAPEVIDGSFRTGGGGGGLGGDGGRGTFGGGGGGGARGAGGSGNFILCSGGWTDCIFGFGGGGGGTVTSGFAGTGGDALARIIHER